MSNWGYFLLVLYWFQNKCHYRCQYWTSIFSVSLKLSREKFTFRKTDVIRCLEIFGGSYWQIQQEYSFPMSMIYGRFRRFCYKLSSPNIWSHPSGQWFLSRCSSISSRLPKDRLQSLHTWPRVITSNYFWCCALCFLYFLLTLHDTYSTCALFLGPVKVHASTPCVVLL